MGCVPTGEQTGLESVVPREDLPVEYEVHLNCSDEVYVGEEVAWFVVDFMYGGLETVVSRFSLVHGNLLPLFELLNEHSREFSAPSC